MKIKIAIATTGALLAATLLLTGCVPAETAASPAPAPTTASPTPEPTGALPQPGDALTMEQADFILSNPDLGIGVYLLGDGTWILVDPNAPLPANVVADVQGNVAAITAGYGGDGAASGRDIRNLAFQIEENTHRPIVIVSSGLAGWDDGSRPDSIQWFARTATDTLNLDESQRTREAAIAVAQAWVAANGGEVIVLG